MSEFSAAQLKELETLLAKMSDGSVQLARRYTDSAITAERERLARIVETCEPFSDLAAEGVSGVQDEVPDLEATLQALGRAIRTGHHEE